MTTQHGNPDELTSLEKIDKSLNKADKVVVVNLNTPVVTESMFAELTGLTRGEVRGQADREHLPTVKFGRKRLINLHKIQLDCEE